jgi:hypothetical protein
MTQRLLDILDANRNAIHTHLVTTSVGSDADFMAKSLETTVGGQFVPDAELARLTAGIRHRYEGRMAPDDDHLAGGSQTSTDLEQEVRERAYLLWEQEGRLEGRSDEYWHRALDQHLPERVYTLWQQRA